MNDASTIIQRAVDRGVGQADLVRAAVACARAVLPLTPPREQETAMALNAAECWAANSSKTNASLALNAAPNLDGIRDQDTADNDVCGLLAAAMAALAAANADFASLTAVMSVQFAEKAAAGRGIDLAPLVTAELL